MSREAYRRLQNDGKIDVLPDRAYLFSPNSAVPRGDGLDELLEVDADAVRACVGASSGDSEASGEGDEQDAHGS